MAQAQDNDAEDNGSFLAFNHYPATDGRWKPGDSMRLHAHAGDQLLLLKRCMLSSCASMWL